MPVRRLNEPVDAGAIDLDDPVNRSIAAQVGHTPAGRRSKDASDYRAALVRIDKALRAVYSEDGLRGDHGEIDEAVGECFLALADVRI